jgi:hypothetical protein
MVWKELPKRKRVHGDGTQKKTLFILPSTE